MSHQFGSAPLIVSGTISSSANAVVDNFFQLIRTNVLAHTSSDGNPSWEESILSDLEYTGSAAAYSRDVVWHSVGIRNTGSNDLIGDTDIWLRFCTSYVQNTSGRFALLCMQDFDDENLQFPNRIVTATNSLIYQDFDPSAQIDYYLWLNEYEISCIYIQNGNWKMFGAGSLLNPSSERTSGVARLADNNLVSGATTGTVINLDRNIKYDDSDVSRLQVNQGVWLVRQRQSGENLSASGLMDENSIVTVTNISADGHQITISGNVLQDYPSGSLVGVDPQGLYQIFDDTKLYSLNNIHGTGTYNSPYFLNVQVPSIYVSNQAIPNNIGFHDLVPGELVFSANPWGRKGKLRFLYCVSQGTISDRDIVIGDNLSGTEGIQKSWRVFPSLAPSSLNNDYRFALGSGALG